MHAQHSVLSLACPHMLQAVVDKYAAENLVGEENVMNIMEKLVDLTNIAEAGEDLQGAVCGEVVDKDTADAVQRVREEQLQELRGITDVKPTAQQARVLKKLQGAITGVHVISGGPGTGKTFITRHLVHYFRTKGVKTVSETAALVALAENRAHPVHVVHDVLCRLCPPRQARQPRASANGHRLCMLLLACLEEVVARASTCRLCRRATHCTLALPTRTCSSLMKCPCCRVTY